MAGVVESLHIDGIIVKLKMFGNNYNNHPDFSRNEAKYDDFV
jgi:hypothetical protein